MTLETADLLAIAGIVLGSMLAVVGGALAWLRADIARLDDRQRASGARVDGLIQVFSARSPARDSRVNVHGLGNFDSAPSGSSSKGIVCRCRTEKAT